MVRSYLNEKTLTLMKLSTFEQVCDPPGATAEVTPATEGITTKVLWGNICTGDLNILHACLHCASKLTDISSALSRCRMLQKVDHMSYKAAMKIYVQDEDGNKVLVQAYTKDINIMIKQYSTQLRELEGLLVARTPKVTLEYNTNTMDVVNIILNNCFCSLILFKL